MLDLWFRLDRLGTFFGGALTLQRSLGHVQVGSCRIGAVKMVYIPYRSLIEALCTLNSHL